MSKFWNAIVQGIEPYAAGEQPDGDYIKLNMNENPFAPSPQVIQAIQQAANADLRFYPHPNGDDLREAIGEEHGFPLDHIFIGNGSDEVLAMCFMAFFENKDGKKLRFPDLTYGFYPVYANLLALSYDTVPVDEDLKVNVKDYLHHNTGVVIANPNAPTSRALPLKEIEEILQHNQDCVVIIDEAYIDFGGTSALSLIEHYPNLVVTRTLSKSRSLAGMRVGYCIAQPELIEGINRIKNSINSHTVDTVAQAAAEAAIKDTAYFNKTVQSLIQTRDHTKEALRQIGFKVIDSSTNFLLATHEKYDAASLTNQLKKQKILIRYFPNGRINDYIRISIGTEEEMEQFIHALTDIMNDDKA
ncbi:histidinol-phosphate transaminase [Longirhabdus pacifica]|uniref:histidinol-phosphate transaminase n=1 Tax=Longirhabdus pacifica TaxID=2305227 RepID=UPI001008B17F|nr:histidinol-phosphate transaminase [Longirhabdus pacifica]